MAFYSWIHLHPEYSFVHIFASNSDHHPISLNTAFPFSLLPRPFRFEEFWTKDPKCGLVIDTTWKVHIFGSPTHCLVKKLHHTKNSLKRWNLYHFGNVQGKIKSTISKLDQIQQSPPTQILSLWNQTLRLPLMIFRLKRRSFGDPNLENPGSPALTSTQSSFTPPLSLEGDPMPPIFSRLILGNGFLIEQPLEIILFPNSPTCSLSQHKVLSCLHHHQKEIQCHQFSQD
jgi:hypothetical protein